MDDPRALIAVAGLLAATSCSEAPPPFAEALVIVDTNAQVPHAVNRLRIDFYDSGGRWFESRDIARPDPRDWPVSFSVFSEDEVNTSSVWLRLRVYPEGRVRDYLGERFRGWGGPLEEPLDGDGEPRLWVDDADVTPTTEPEPLTAIDQLVHVSLEPGVRGRLLVLLDAACAGTMVAFGGDGSGPHDDATSCLREQKRSEPVLTRHVEAGVLSVPTSTLTGTRPGCEGVSNADGLYGERVCIPGGAALMGSSELSLYPDLEPRPERLFVHSAFLIDRYEVSVARFRDALSRGFVPTLMPFANEGPITGSVDGSCSWSNTDVGREAFGLSCVSWAAARELCLWSGGDLPTEAQYEHMATLASDHGRSRYPWGDSAPDCGSASYGRLMLAGVAGVCEHEGTGPEPIDPDELGDITREGVIGLAGHLGEWMRDDYAEYRSQCWGDASIIDPMCDDPDAAAKASRGGAWAAPPTILPSAVRLGSPPLNRASFTGLRCAYPVGAP